MTRTRRLAAALAVLGLAVASAGPSLGAGAHSHGTEAATRLEVKLNNGKRWQSDEALRTGMSKMRAEVASALPKIHKGKFSPADYSALAGKLHGQIDYVTANCKLPEDADLVLHGILEQMIAGADAMKAEGNRAAGALKIVEALNVYGKSFDHPGWKTIAP